MPVTCEMPRSAPTSIPSAFIDTGRLFEFTETRYSPEHFSFTQFFSK